MWDLDEDFEDLMDGGCGDATENHAEIELVFVELFFKMNVASDRILTRITW